MICRFFLDRGISQQTHIQCVGKGFGVLCIQATAVIAERVLNVLSDFRSYFLAVLPEWGPPPDVRSEVLPSVVLGVLPVYIKPHQLTLLRHRIPQCTSPSPCLLRLREFHSRNTRSSRRDATKRQDIHPGAR